MNSTKKVFGIPGIWVPMAVMLIGGAVPFFGWEYPFGGEREEKKERIDNLEKTKNRLPASPRKAKIEESKPKEEPKPVAQSSLSLESMSDEEYQAMVLDHVKASDRQLVEQHFKQENAFKAALKPSDKQRFDADVKRECAKLLANSGVQEGDLSNFLNQTIRRCAESMVITKWRVKESVSQQDDRWKRYIERKREENRRWHEEFNAELAERLGPEFFERMQENAE